MTLVPVPATLATLVRILVWLPVRPVSPVPVHDLPHAAVAESATTDATSVPAGGLAATKRRRPAWFLHPDDP
jgi:hypothetical protein